MRHCSNATCPHREATGRSAELRDDIEICPDCGEPTQWGSPPSDVPSGQELIPDREPSVDHLRLLAEFTNVHEAEMAREMLRAYGIDAELTDRYVTGMGVPLHVLGRGLQLLVPSGTLEDARALLSEDTDAG